ncbi:MAG: molybdopterin-dependent oxidoreductase [Deltaproteobacteria bacterium]|nr:molybdopterin-dependent oxidoreductase [Deltaproteobacteria bacterium]
MGTEGKIAVRTYCPLSKSRCAIICFVEDGKLTEVRKDPDHPNCANLCPKGIAAPELVYHPERLKHPLKRTNPKTADDPGWKRISWDEALDTISRKLLAAKDTYGAESVVFGKGASGGSPANDYKEWVNRLAYAFGTPNWDLGTTHICNWHKDKGSTYTYGTKIPMPHFENTRCILLWGHNPAATWRRHEERIKAARKRGAKIIIIDPRRNETWQEGDLWLSVRPGTDGALALGMLHVMLEEKLYDDEFARNWTTAPFLVRRDTGKYLRQEEVDASGKKGNYLAWDRQGGGFLAYDPRRKTYEKQGNPELEGTRTVTLPDGKNIECKTAFQLLREMVSPFSPEKTAAITWVEAEKIREATRLFCSLKPACYYTYNGIEQQTNAMQTSRAIGIFFSLSGNFDVPGGNVMFPRIKTNKIDGKREFSPKKKPLGKDKRPLGPGNVQAKDLYETLLTGKPYPVKAVMAFGGNVLTANGDSRLGREALAKLDFFVQVDMFETPAGQMADILLPAATPWESFFLKPTFEGDEKTSSYVQLMPQVIPPLHESRPDIRIIFDLAEKLGLKDKFWNGDQEAAFNYQLAPSGITVADLRKNQGGIFVSLPVKYRKYREPQGEGVNGFDTPSGLVEIYSETFLEKGYDPLPRHTEPPMSPLSQPELARKYPFILTNFKLLAYCHGQHRGLPLLRKMVPHPYVEINAGKAREMGIMEGEWVILETPRGSIRLQAKLKEGIAPGVVSTQHGWWQGCAALGLPAYDPFSEQGANVNMVVSNELHDPITGCVPHKSYLCNIRKTAAP